MPRVWRRHASEMPLQFPDASTHCIITGTVALIGTTLLFAQRQTTPQPRSTAAIAFPRLPTWPDRSARRPLRGAGDPALDILDYRPSHARRGRAPDQLKISSVDIRPRGGNSTTWRVWFAKWIMNLRVLQQPERGSGERLQRNVDAIDHSTTTAATFRQPCFRAFAPGWGPAAAQLEQDVRNGAVGLKIFKDLEWRRVDGWIAIDDPGSIRSGPQPAV